MDARTGWRFPERPRFEIPLPDGQTLHLGERPLVMGVLNVTPDSFADSTHIVTGSATLDVSHAVAMACEMAAAGADIIDVGGESTRPGAPAISAQEELERVMPVIDALRRAVQVPISIDTYKAEVASHALAGGAVIVNDISGFQYEPGLARVVAATGAAVILMHTRGRSATMYAEARYADLITEVGDDLERSIAVALAAGVPRGQIVVDPGIGFAKRAEHSYGVLARFPELAARLDRPVLIGPSRKSFLQVAVGERPAVDRDWATAAAVSAAVLAGAHIVRVHAVRELVQVVRVAETIRAAGVNETRH